MSNFNSEPFEVSPELAKKLQCKQGGCVVIHATISEDACSVPGQRILKNRNQTEFVIRPFEYDEIRIIPNPIPDCVDEAAYQSCWGVRDIFLEVVPEDLRKPYSIWSATVNHDARKITFTNKQGQTIALDGEEPLHPAIPNNIVRLAVAYVKSQAWYTPTPCSVYNLTESTADVKDYRGLPKYRKDIIFRDVDNIAAYMRANRVLELYYYGEWRIIALPHKVWDDIPIVPDCDIAYRSLLVDRHYSCIGISIDKSTNFLRVYNDERVIRVLGKVALGEDPRMISSMLESLSATERGVSVEYWTHRILSELTLLTTERMWFTIDPDQNTLTTYRTGKVA